MKNSMNPAGLTLVRTLLLTAVFAVFLVIYTPLTCAAAQELDPGTFSIGGELQLDYFYHKTGEKWDAFKTGYKNTNYNYSYTPSISTSPAGSGSFGETFLLNVGFRPVDALTADLGFEFIGDYADRFWMPLNYENRMKADALSGSWIRADIKYDQDWWSLRYFRGTGHYNWSYEGDLFGLFPEQFETDKYLRLTGRPIPEGVELNMKGSAGTLTVFQGPELIWDYKNGTYAKYNFDISRAEMALIYTDHIIPWGDPNETMRSFELSSRVKVLDNPLGIGILYRPFRLDRSYSYLDEVAPGTGDLGSKYVKKTGVTSSSDALGAAVSLDLKPGFIVNGLTLKYKYEGLVAGDMQEYGGYAYRKLSRSWMGSLDAIYRKPLYGPIPLIYEGTAADPGPALFVPRGPADPFTVNWDNREANILSFVFTFDPTPETWFYKYQPNLPEEWNLNPNENAKFSFAARYKLSKYYTTTDRLYYFDSLGNVVWEDPLVEGAFATNNYIGYFDVIGKLLAGKLGVLFTVGFGDQLAGSSYAYIQSNLRPITDSFTSGLTFLYSPYKLKLQYGENVWGPEEYERTFGEAFDQLYQADIIRDFGNSISAGVGYVGARNGNHKYLAPDLGEYDEIHCYLTLSFGPGVVYFGSKPEEGGKLTGQAPPKDTTPPLVSMKIGQDRFSPGVEGDFGPKLPLELFATDENGIAGWNVTVSDQNNRVVKTISGIGEVPFSVQWDGTDDIYGKTVPDGKYSIRFEAADTYDNKSQTDPKEIETYIPPKVVVREVTKEVKTIETERGLLVTMTSSVLFDSGKSKLKPSADNALKEVVKILNAYPDNKISVEGHTDNIGSAKFNLKLSEGRARSVAEFLTANGISKDRIDIKGFGKNKPVASNSTAVGREENRRVEVIILKAK
jgi:outer membrane protein OmpA-like peptidoglycan-associated protein